MELRAILIIFASVLAEVFGQKQCGNQRKCVPFSDCAEYRSYVGKSPNTWPLHVRNEIVSLSCGMEQGRSGKIYKFCCKEKPVITGKPAGHGALDLENCGRQGSKDRIAHGEIAEVFEFPWMVLLGDFNGEFHCGGSLITKSFVLTAAHCNHKTVFFVRVGETYIATPIDCNHAVGEAPDCAEPYQDIPVDRFIGHQRYSSSKKKNDIALIKLKKPAKLNHNVRPICLPLPEMLPRELPSKMIVSGWGYTEDQHADAAFNELRYARIPIVEPNRCREFIRQRHNVFTVDESHVCAGNDNDRKDNCKGDSGGPLQYFGNKGYVIHGVVAWGLSSCGNESAPGVYTKVSHYLDWIIDNLK